MTVHAVMASKARHFFRSSAALSLRSLIRVPVLTVSEPLLDQPAFLVPSDDAERVLLRGLAFGGQEQPVEPVPARRRRLLQDAHCEHGEWGRALWQVSRRDEVDETGPQLQLDVLAPLARPGAATGRDVDRLLRDDIQFGRVREQVLDPAVRRDGPSPARTAGADQEACAAGRGSAGLRQERPHVAFTVAHGHHAGSRAGRRQLGGLGEGLRPASAFLALHRRRLVLRAKAGIKAEYPQCATALAERNAGMSRDPLASRAAAADVDKALRRLQAAVVQHRRVLNRKHDRLPGKAFPRWNSLDFT